MYGLDSEGPFGPSKELKQREDEDAARFRALNFLQTVAANLDNPKLSDAEFRQFMRNSMTGMPGIDYPEEPKESFPILPAESTGYVD